MDGNEFNDDGKRKVKSTNYCVKFLFSLFLFFLFFTLRMNQNASHTHTHTHTLMQRNTRSKQKKTINIFHKISTNRIIYKIKEAVLQFILSCRRYWNNSTYSHPLYVILSAKSNCNSKITTRHTNTYSTVACSQTIIK